MATTSNFTRRAVLRAAPLVALAVTTSMPIALGAGTSSDDPALKAMARMRSASRVCDGAYEAHEKAETSAQSAVGRRPWELIAWRNYSAIGGSELAGARDYLLARGLSPATAEAEFKDAKHRHNAAIRAGRQWDRKAGVVELRRVRFKALRDYRASLWQLARTVPTTPAGAAAMSAWLGKELVNYDEKYHSVMAKSIARGLRVMAREAS